MSNNFQDLISIIVPFWNVEKYIQRCLESLLSQTYLNIEFILVDDFSTDNSLNIIQKYSIKDERVRVLQYKKKGGAGGARNYALKRANGKYILFVDSDDYVTINTAIEQIYRKAKDNNLCILESNYLKQEKGNTNILPKRVVLLKNVLSGKEYWQSIPIASESVCNKLYKTSFLIDNNILFKHRKFEDVSFNAEAFMKAKRVMNINFIYYKYCVRENSITTSQPTIQCLVDAYDLIKDMRSLYYDNSVNEQLKMQYLQTYTRFFRFWHLYNDDQALKIKMKKQVLGLFYKSRELILDSKKMSLKQKILLLISPIFAAKIYLYKR